MDGAVQKLALTNKVRRPIWTAEECCHMLGIQNVTNARG